MRSRFLKIAIFLNAGDVIPYMSRGGYEIMKIAEYITTKDMAAWEII